MEQPPPQPQPTNGHGVLVSVDVANVGVLWTRDPEFTWEALNQLEGLLETMVEDMGGTVQDHEGESFIVRFTAPAPAVMWCARMQEGMLALDWPDALAGTPDEVGVQEMLFGGLMARMAIHAGSIEELQSIVGLAHAGQVLVSGTTFDLIQDPIPADLRVESIGTVESVSGPMELRQVTTRLLSRRRFPRLASRTSGLPFAPNCFVGRQADLADLKERLQAGARMVNITSEDGMGKTRLALHWARLVEPITNGGSALVRLHGTRDTTDLMIATASALGISLGRNTVGDVSDRIGHAIAARGDCVVVFDAFEPHLDLNALITWIRAAPDAQFVVTSTAPLSTELSTHLSLGGLTESDAKALHLSRLHRTLRSTDRPIHANQIELPESLGDNPAAIEETIGLRSPRWRDDEQTVLALRHRALNSDHTDEERTAAALDAVPILVRMGLSGIAHALLMEIEATFSDDTAAWTSSCAFALINAGRLTEAHSTLDCNSSDPRVELMRAHLALAEARYQDAVNHASPHSDDPAHAFVHGLALAALDEWEESVEFLDAAAQSHPDPIEQSWALAALGRVHQDLGHATKAEECLQSALIKGACDPHLLARVHHHRFEAASAVLQMDEAREHLNRALAILNRCGDRSGTADALLHIAVLDLIQRAPEAAQDRLNRARRICRMDGLTSLEARTLLTQGIAHRASGDIGGALDAFVEAAALAEQNHALLGMIHSHNGAAEAAVDAIDNAEAAFKQAEEHLNESWDMLANTMHDMLLGFVDLARAREAALGEADETPDHHIDRALNRLARGSSFETRSLPPRGRESPSRINEFRLARLMLDNAIAALGPSETE